MKKNFKAIEIINKIEFYTRGRFAVDGKVIYKACDEEHFENPVDATRELIGAKFEKLNKTNKIDP